MKLKRSLKKFLNSSKSFRLKFFCVVSDVIGIRFLNKKVSLLQLFRFLLKLFLFFSLPGAMTFRLTTFILMTLSKWWHYHNSCFSECQFFTEMQSDKMVHFARISVVIKNVVMLTVVAPFFLVMKGSFTHFDSGAIFAL
jgi:hypothetical protein